MNNSLECKPINIFISYSWDNEYHKDWVLKLANKLVDMGINVSLDRYELSLGKSLQYFVEDSIKIADRILIIFTPNYKKKADNRKGGVGYEYSIMNAELYKNPTTNNKIIPILKDGDIASSIPVFMQQYIHLDMRDDDKLELSFIELLRDIYKEPKIKKPMLGAKPDFLNLKSKNEESVHKYERTIGKIIDILQESEEFRLTCFHLWKNDEQIRRFIEHTLQFYYDNEYTLKILTNFRYCHLDETGDTIMTFDTFESYSPIFRLFKARTLLWDDPHNCKIMITSYGKELLDYLKKTKQEII